eukprot:CAMPEP_0196580184 /NCGR_PEP_ID=MMETSP1081-20130531/27641_1 /TAXON_ID=36882 /ORGANISM="Pyramimonas amylifera, Strain CCMP720" /LENGTH=352 /DNA_ID=CAMNT_0041899991 /DNA_START=59 /DNA_END=1117 /DNA_ORIENTATION=-
MTQIAVQNTQRLWAKTCPMDNIVRLESNITSGLIQVVQTSTVGIEENKVQVVTKMTIAGVVVAGELTAQEIAQIQVGAQAELEKGGVVVALEDVIVVVGDGNSRRRSLLQSRETAVTLAVIVDKWKAKLLASLLATVDNEFAGGSLEVASVDTISSLFREEDKLVCEANWALPWGRCCKGSMCQPVCEENGGASGCDEGNWWVEEDMGAPNSENCVQRRMGIVTSLTVAGPCPVSQVNGTVLQWRQCVQSSCPRTVPPPDVGTQGVIERSGGSSSGMELALLFVGIVVGTTVVLVGVFCSIRLWRKSVSRKRKERHIDFHEPMKSPLVPSPSAGQVRFNNMYGVASDPSDRL